MASTMQQTPPNSSIDCIIEQLQLKCDRNNLQDRKQLSKILETYLLYPSNKEAQKHERANRLGLFDEKQNRKTLKQKYLKSNVLPQMCPCCCCITQQDLPFTVSLDNIQTLGQATSLFFLNLRYAIVLMVSAFCIYTGYSVLTNITAWKNTNGEGASLNMIALGAKLEDKSEINRSLYQVQVWLGLAMSIVWGMIMIFKVRQEKQLQIEEDFKNPSASDFTVMIEDMPKRIGIDDFEAIINLYTNTVKQSIIVPEDNDQVKYNKDFKVVCFNEAKAFYQTLQDMNQSLASSNLEKTYRQKRQTLMEIVLSRRQFSDFPLTKQARQNLYYCLDVCLDQIKKQRLKKLAQMKQKLRQLNSNKQTKLVFVTFSHSFARINLCQLNSNSIKSKIAACFRKNPNLLQIPGITITRAPEPQDIIWQNIGVPFRERVFRKTLTYIITLIILAISFVIIYFATLIDNQAENIYISILISIFITLVNGILAGTLQVNGAIIRVLTLSEKDYRFTFLQISLAFKSVLAQLINSIVLTIIVYYFIKANLFGQRGLAQDVLYFSISNAIIPPLLKILDPLYGIWKLKKWMFSKPEKKLANQTQQQYNKLWQRMEFEIGYEYVHMLKTCIYTAFYISLQPIIAPISGIGLLLMYYAEKYVLLYRCSRPKPSSDLINSSLSIIMNLCILAYSLGSLTWTSFIPTNQPQYVIVPNIICLILGCFIFVFPFSELIDFCKKSKQRAMNYEEERVFFVSQYDRLNPNTRTEGIKRFYDNVEDKRYEYLGELLKKDDVILKIIEQKDTSERTAFSENLLQLLILKEQMHNYAHSHAQNHAQNHAQSHSDDNAPDGNFLLNSILINPKPQHPKLLQPLPQYPRLPLPLQQQPQPQSSNQQILNPIPSRQKFLAPRQMQRSAPSRPQPLPRDLMNILVHAVSDTDHSTISRGLFNPMQHLKETQDEEMMRTVENVVVKAIGFGIP